LKPILLPMSGVAGLWIAATIQATLVTVFLLLILRRMAPSLSPAGAFALIFVVALFTSLPWHVAQLMPDTFTGPLILLTWLAATRDPAATGSPLLWLAAAILALLHYTHLGLLIVSATVTIAVGAAFGVCARQIGKRALVGVTVIALVIGAQVAANGIFLSRWSVSPLGSWFLFARLNEDGLIPRWLDRHCGYDAPRELCEVRASLPRDSQKLLWVKSSPLAEHIQGSIGTPQFWHWVDMMGQAVKGSIREEPLAFAASVTKGGLRQFVHFQALDDLCPATCTIPSLTAVRPDVTPALLGSRQLKGEVPKGIIRAVTTPPETLALLLLIPFLIAAWRRKDQESVTLVATIAACLVANAAMGGGLSAVNDRYQSRVVWLVPFAELLLIARWHMGVNPPSAPAARGARHETRGASRPRAGRGRPRA
jgi:hypothetical protein